MNTPMTMPRAVLAAMLLTSTAAGAATPVLSARDQGAAFRAAGFSLQGKQWRQCDDPSPAYVPGEIAEVRDLNGDGRPEALITESSSACYGHAGAGYALVSRQADGSWKKIAGGTGMASFLSTRGKDGWPDIEVGGPGFCFPVERWNGKAYVLQRHQYEGKACRPGR
ncbi:hypothetical protein LE190_19770 [Massilia oculi]|uniref:Uncharacterized protein n=1 Tax=Massilia hydrophila TaxID=3044279 RepID=A0ABS7YEK9_9BURK|nr:hypothetical protein [Massilia oculi]MCA1858151.1 hypothetical protein [Massilia oculi]